MSGDVQPRKRQKDKKRRRDDEGTPPPGMIRGSSTESDNVTLHIPKDPTTGGHWCVKIIFFALMAALLGVIGLIILEYRGESDVDFPLEKSQWALIFDGWVDESVSLNHEDDHDKESDEHDHDEDDNDHNSEDGDDEHASSTETDDEHSDSSAQEDDPEESSENNSNADEEEDENVSDNVLGSYEDVYEPEDAECDALLGEASNEGSENEWLEQLRDLEEQARILGIDLNDVDSNENDSGISQEDDDPDDQNEEDEEGNDKDDENDGDNDLSSERVQADYTSYQGRKILQVDDDDAEDEGFYDDNNSQTGENDNDDLGPLEEVENFSEEDEIAEENKDVEKEAFYNESEEDWDVSLEGVPVERKYSAVDELDDDEVIIATVTANIDDESNEPLEEVEHEGSEEVVNDSTEDDEEADELEEESTSLALKFGIGVALIVTAHFVLIRRWSSNGDQYLNDELPALSRRNTLIDPSSNANEEDITSKLIADLQNADFGKNDELYTESSQGEYEEEEEEYSEDLEPEITRVKEVRRYDNNARRRSSENRKYRGVPEPESEEEQLESEEYDEEEMDPPVDYKNVILSAKLPASQITKRSPGLRSDFEESTRF